MALPYWPGKRPYDLSGKAFINCGMAVLGCEMNRVSVCLLFMCNCTTVNVA